MTDNKIIHVLASGACDQMRRAKAGYVSHLLITGVRYPAALRQNPPRIKLLEDNVIGKFMPCELLDEWPDHPDRWPLEPVAGPSTKPAGPPPISSRGPSVFGASALTPERVAQAMPIEPPKRKARQKAMV
jgi:hypothetical protein